MHLDTEIRTLFEVASAVFAENPVYGNGIGFPQNAGRLYQTPKFTAI
jgi:hypothetical protein